MPRVCPAEQEKLTARKSDFMVSRPLCLIFFLIPDSLFGLRRVYKDDSLIMPIPFDKAMIYPKQDHHLCTNIVRIVDGRELDES